MVWHFRPVAENRCHGRCYLSWALLSQLDAAGCEHHRGAPLCRRGNGLSMRTCEDAVDVEVATQDLESDTKSGLRRWTARACVFMRTAESHERAHVTYHLLSLLGRM